MKTIAVVISILVLANVVHAGDWNDYKHPSGVVEFSTPEEWGEPLEHQYGPNVIIFYTGSEVGEFTLSIQELAGLPKVLPGEMFRSFFHPTEKPVGYLERKSGAGWESMRQDYIGEKHGSPYQWSAKLIRMEDTIVMATIGDTPSLSESNSAIIEQVLESIEVR